VVVIGLVMDGDQPRTIDGVPQAVGAVLRTDECQILDTWHSLGMRGTDSSDVCVADVFVPASRTYRVVAEFEPGPHYSGPIYRTPAMVVVGLIAPLFLAMARGAIEELRTLAERKTPFASTTPLRERASAQGKLGWAEAAVCSARAFLDQTLEQAWQRTLAGEPSSLRQKAELLLASVHAASSAAKVVELMYGAAGTSAIYARSPLERHFRDVQTLKQHGFLSESRYETAGQVYFGLSPDLAFVAF
jgi:indole-3-acetate monooxygenase